MCLLQKIKVKSFAKSQKKLIKRNVYNKPIPTVRSIKNVLWFDSCYIVLLSLLVFLFNFYFLYNSDGILRNVNESKNNNKIYIDLFRSQFCKHLLRVSRFIYLFFLLLLLFHFALIKTIACLFARRTNL